MDFVQIVLDFKRNLEVFELLRDEPAANEVSDDQGREQGSNRHQRQFIAGRNGGRRNAW